MYVVVYFIKNFVVVKCTDLPVEFHNILDENEDDF